MTLWPSIFLRQVKWDSVWTAKKEKYYDDEQLYISFTIFGNGMEMLARSPKSSGWWVQTLCWAGRRLAGGFAGCAGGELVEITSQLHRALPRHTRLQWEVPADYSGCFNHPSITWNFHTQPSININPPSPKLKKSKKSLELLMINTILESWKSCSISITFVKASRSSSIAFKSICIRHNLLLFLYSCFMVQSMERSRFIWNWISLEIWNKNVAVSFVWEVARGCLLTSLY